MINRMLFVLPSEDKWWNLILQIISACGYRSFRDLFCLSTIGAINTELNFDLVFDTLNVDLWSMLWFELWCLYLHTRLQCSIKWWWISLNHLLHTFERIVSSLFNISKYSWCRSYRQQYIRSNRTHGHS